MWVLFDDGLEHRWLDLVDAFELRLSCGVDLLEILVDDPDLLLLHLLRMELAGGSVLLLHVKGLMRVSLLLVSVLVGPSFGLKDFFGFALDEVWTHGVCV